MRQRCSVRVNAGYILRGGLSAVVRRKRAREYFMYVCKFLSNLVPEDTSYHLEYLEGNNRARF